LVWFGFLEQKPVQTGLAWFFLVWLSFFSLARFFLFGFGSVWFFWFQAYKTKTKPNQLVFLKF